MFKISFQDSDLDLALKVNSQLSKHVDALLRGLQRNKLFLDKHSIPIK